MIADQSHSAYVVQSTIIRLDDLPFLPNKKCNRVWSKIFQNESCFSDNAALLEYWNDDPKDFRSVDKPFFKGIGTIIQRYCSRPFYWDREYPGLDDERMKFQYYEVFKPLSIHSRAEADIRARGDVFFHVYPSGYIVIHLAITLFWKKDRTLRELQKVIRETRPWRSDTRWLWSSKFGDLRLKEFFESFERSLMNSIVEDGAAPKTSDSWFTSIRIAIDADPQQIAEQFLITREGFQVLKMDPAFTKMSFFLVSRQGLVCVYQQKFSRRSAIRFFWKIHSIAEFVHLNHRIYDDYTAYLQKQAAQLKDYRLSPIRKIEKESIFKFTVYDHKIPQFISVLDSEISYLIPFYRRIYHTIATATNFDKKKEILKEVIGEWESEVGLWEPKLVAIWNKIISPLRSLLSK